MAEPFLGEIRMFCGNFAPSGWALCNGQLLSIQQNAALFSILGTTYGGNGLNNFGLPDLRGRVPIHPGQGPGLSLYSLGQLSGSESVNLQVSQLPSHTHALGCASGGGTQASPVNAYPAVESTGTSLDYASAADSTMNPAMSQLVGSGLPVPILQPYLCVNFIIALQGIFPSRN